ncbi:pseudouridine synthase, partial [Streptobacillus felis]|uniref:pseudouridine synthase n=1 Tax=Streptobacillus felis TaxID=1384509 RepID=UPI000A476358
MLNKTKGYISATEDLKQKTVLDLITDFKTYYLLPVGRLDIDTEVLLLLTNYGNLAHNL